MNEMLTEEEIWTRFPDEWILLDQLQTGCYHGFGHPSLDKTSEKWPFSGVFDLPVTTTGVQWPNP